MGFDARPLLEHWRIFESHDLEEARAFLQSKDFELDFSGRESAGFDFVASSAYLPGSYVGYIRYGSEVRIRAPAERKRDDYFVHFPFRGASEVFNQEIGRA